MIRKAVESCLPVHIFFEKHLHHRLEVLTRSVPNTVLTIISGEECSGIVKDAPDTITLHGPVTFVGVEADKMPVFAVGDYAATHQAGDGPHAASQMCGEFTFGFPVLGGSLVLIGCSIHNLKVWRDFAQGGSFRFLRNRNAGAARYSPSSISPPKPNKRLKDADKRSRYAARMARCGIACVAPAVRKKWRRPGNRFKRRTPLVPHESRTCASR